MAAAVTAAVSMAAAAAAADSTAAGTMEAAAMPAATSAATAAAMPAATATTMPMPAATATAAITVVAMAGVPRSAAELVVAPIAIEFARQHPEVTIEVIVGDALTDIVASGFDAGVRFGESLQQDMIAVRIGPAQRGVIVGSPAYFEGRRVPVTPSDLQDHVCIRRRFAGGGIYRWELEKDGEAVVVAVDGGLILNDDRLIADAALTGAGLAYVFEGQVKTKIAAGDLITVLDDWCPSFPGFFLYYPSRRLMRPTLRALVDFARAS